MALLDHFGHQRLDAGLAQGLRHQSHLLPAPMGVHEVGLHQRGDEFGEALLVDVAHAAHDFLEDALPLGGDIGLDAQRLDALDQHAADHLHRRGAAGLRTQHLGLEAVGVHPGHHRLDIRTGHQHRRLDALLEESAHDGDVDIATACRLDRCAVLVRHAAGHGAEIEIVCALLQQRCGGFRGFQRVLALDGADHEVGLAQCRGVATLDRDIELAGLLAERGATRVLVEGRVDGNDAARSVVARPQCAAPTTFGAKPAGDRRSRLTKAQQRDHARRQRHANALDGLFGEAQEAGASPSSALRAARESWAVSRELAIRSLGRATTSAGDWLRSATPA